MFTVIEMQDDHENVGILTYSFDNIYDASEKYYDILRYAAQSAIPIHSAMIVQNGWCIKSDCMTHIIEGEE